MDEFSLICNETLLWATSVSSRDSRKIENDRRGDAVALQSAADAMKRAYGINPVLSPRRLRLNAERDRISVIRKEI